jgi:hypothetical protein
MAVTMSPRAAVHDITLGLGPAVGLALDTLL